MKNEISTEKEELKKLQAEQLNLWKRIRGDERKRFNEVDMISVIAKSKNDDDLQFLMEKFSEWVNASKNDSSKNKVYIDLLKCLYRIHSYCFNIETTVSQAVAMAKTAEQISDNTASSLSKEKLLLMSKIKQQEQEIDRLKKELAFINQTSQ